ncbi:hypothetical protein Taro_043441 [Colocasia esculenta]|uniref:Uncharacterized protein n=1 Tax=Colocasia esculenta TaxID=4460 RepID=A0A843WVT2_COLES|nr:hypothetical protein [Colocasia esculenta]
MLNSTANFRAGFWDSQPVSTPSGSVSTPLHWTGRPVLDWCRLSSHSFQLVVDWCRPISNLRYSSI